VHVVRLEDWGEKVKMKMNPGKNTPMSKKSRRQERRKNHDGAPVVVAIVAGLGGGIGFVEPPPVGAGPIGKKEFEVGDTVGVGVEGSGALNSFESLNAISSLLVEAGDTRAVVPFGQSLTGVEQLEVAKVMSTSMVLGFARGAYFGSASMRAIKSSNLIQNTCSIERNLDLSSLRAFSSWLMGLWLSYELSQSITERTDHIRNLSSRVIGRRLRSVYPAKERSVTPRTNTA